MRGRKSREASSESVPVRTSVSCFNKDTLKKHLNKTGAPFGHLDAPRRLEEDMKELVLPLSAQEDDVGRNAGFGVEG